MPASDAHPAQAASPGDMLAALFAFFEAVAVPYCVVGDTRAYPGRVSGDVDIVVAPDVLVAIPERIAQFCRQHDVRLIQAFRHDRTATCYVLAWTDRSGNPSYLHPDVFGDYYERGRLLLTARELLDGRIPAADDRGAARGFAVPRPDRAFVYYLLKKVGKGEIDESHAAYLSAQWRLDPQACGDQVRRFWPHSTATLIASCAASGGWQPVREAMPHVRASMRPLKPYTFRSRVAGRWHDVRRVHRPAGLWIVLDGDAGAAGAAWASLIPLARPAFLGVDVLQGEAVGGLRSWWTYWRRLRPSLVQARLVASVHSAGTRLYGGAAGPGAAPLRTRLGRRLGGLAPEPDLVFILDRSGGEASRTRMAGSPDTYVLDATEPPRTVARRMLRLLIDHLTRRSAARLSRRYPIPPQTPPGRARP